MGKNLFAFVTLFALSSLHVRDIISLVAALGDMSASVVVGKRVNIRKSWIYQLK